MVRDVPKERRLRRNMGLRHSLLAMASLKAYLLWRCAFGLTKRLGITRGLRTHKKVGLASTVGNQPFCRLCFTLMLLSMGSHAVGGSRRRQHLAGLRVAHLGQHVSWEIG